jgi:acyl carrier protein
MLIGRKKAIEAAFQGRLQLSKDEFWQLYFKHIGVPEDVANGVKEVLETVLDTDLSRLTADDDFSQNINFFFEFDSLADVEIVVELEKKFDIHIQDNKATDTSTIEEIVLLVWNKLRTDHP